MEVCYISSAWSARTNQRCYLSFINWWGVMKIKINFVRDQSTNYTHASCQTKKCALLLQKSKTKTQRLKASEIEKEWEQGSLNRPVGSLKGSTKLHITTLPNWQQPAEDRSDSAVQRGKATAVSICVCALEAPVGREVWTWSRVLMQEMSRWKKSEWKWNSKCEVEKLRDRDEESEC